MSTETIPMDQLARWSGADPVVRAEADPTTDQPALGRRHGERWAAAFVRPTHTHGVSMMFRGDVPLLHDLVGSAPFAPWLAEARAKGADAVTVPRAAEDLGGLLLEARGRWEFMSVTAAPDAPAPERLVELSSADRGAIETLLQDHNPGTDGQPCARDGQRWLGVRDGTGALLAVGCCEPEVSGAPVLTGITVVPAARGLGLGRGLTAELTRGAVAAAGWCTLGMYSHNARAREVYRSLGYVVHAEWSSGRLA